MKRSAQLTLCGGALAWLIAAGCSGTAVIDGGGANATTSSSGSGANSSSSGSGTSSGTSSGAGGFATCNGPGQCELTYKGCCGTCGIPQLGALEAVAVDQLDAYHQSQCPTPEPCPECISCPNGELFAHCNAGSCAGAHLDDFGLRACNIDQDCRLRWGTACYEPCGSVADCGGLTAVALGQEKTLLDMVCDPDAPPPPPCVPTYPADAVPSCNAGHCEVVYVDF